MEISCAVGLSQRSKTGDPPIFSNASRVSGLSFFLSSRSKSANGTRGRQDSNNSAPTKFEQQYLRDRGYTINMPAYLIPRPGFTPTAGGERLSWRLGPAFRSEATTMLRGFRTAVARGYSVGVGKRRKVYAASPLRDLHWSDAICLRGSAMTALARLPEQI